MPKRKYALSTREVRRRVGPDSPLTPKGKEKFKMAIQRGEVKVKRGIP